MSQRFGRIFLPCLAFLILPGVTFGSDVQVSVGVGGLERVLRGQWGLLRGVFANTSDTDREILAVVIPSSSSGLQYARRVVIPARCRRDCQWPVLIPDHVSAAFDFEYLVFENPDGSGAIQRSPGEQVSRGFAVVNPEARNGQTVGYRGLLTSFDESRRDLRGLEAVIDILRDEAHFEKMGITFTASDLDGYPEALECLEQLLITSQRLHHFPEACDAIRVWIQRGGRMWLFLDQTGMETAHALLGDALPLTRIDETSSNVMKLEIEPAASGQSSSEGALIREFAEPVRLVRVIADGGRTLWSVDGWPAVVELPFGNGTVFVTTISPEVFAQIDDNRMSFPCARQIANGMIRVSEKPSPVSEERLGFAAAGSIGYEVPSRLFAAAVMLAFVASLLTTGIVLLRKDRTAWLLWGIPLLAFVCAVPAVWVGGRSRSVAPPTAIHQRVAAVVAGQTTLAADGVTSVYHPSPSVLSVKMTDFALLMPEHAETENNTRRIVWTDRGESEWTNLEQAAGIRNYRIRSLRRLDQPGKLTVTLDQDGLVGRLGGSDGVNASDLILAGLSPDRMAVRMQANGEFRVSPDDTLASTEFVTGTFLTDTQKRRAAVYQGLFDNTGLDNVYPDRLTLLYWSDPGNPSIAVGDEATRQAGSVLLAQTVDLEPPSANTAFSIPPALLPYRTVTDDEGGLSPIFSNTRREWQQRETAGVALLEFDVPDVCHPFDATGGTLVIRLNAGSRPVSLSMGSRDGPALVRTFQSPAGLYTLALSSEHLNSIVETGKVYLRLEVGEMETSGSGEVSLDRDDYWNVGRMMLTLKGVRKQ